jgi:integrase
VVGNNLLPEFDETPLEQITTECVDHYRARLLAEGRLSDRTINKLLVLLHGIFRRAQRSYGLPGNPVAAGDRQRCAGPAVLTPEEIAGLARSAESEQDAALFVTAAFTGLRLGELLALRWIASVTADGSNVRSATRALLQWRSCWWPGRARRAFRGPRRRARAHSSGVHLRGRR